jgi:hypothetical protein
VLLSRALPAKFNGVFIVSSANWTVEVDGVDRNVSVITDPESGKASVRVDGRMAARPLNAEEQEREVMIGRARYMLRRAGDGFDLELIDAPLYIPPPPANRVTREQKMPSKRSFPIFKIIFGIFGTLMLLGVAGYARHAWAYMNAPWSAYKAPDGEFLIDFPGEPLTESEDHNVAGTIITMTQLYQNYRGHLYSIQYTKLPFIVTENREAPLAQQLMEAYASKHNGTILTRDPAWVAKHNGVKFTAKIPKSDENPESLVKGAIAIRKGHAYAVIFARPANDPVGTDGDHFLNSFQLPDD